MVKKNAILCTAVLTLVALFSVQAVWAEGQKEKAPLFGFITNGVNDFWILSQRGVEQAQKDLGIRTDFRTPPNGTMAEQKSIMEDLMAKGASGNRHHRHRPGGNDAVPERNGEEDPRHYP